MKRLILAGTILAVSGLALLAVAAPPPKDTPSAAATRKKLDAVISVDYKDTRLAEIKDDLKEKVKDVTGRDLSIVLDNVGGVSNNLTMTYKGENKPVSVILDEMFAKNDMGYIVINGKYKTYGDRYDGWLLIVKGKERGYPAGTEPVAKTDEPKEDPKTVTKDDPKDPPSAGDADKDEMTASQLLRLAKLFVNSKPETAIERLTDIVKKYPNTKAAAEAKELLAKLKK